MTRDEYKQLMRQELEQDIPAERRDTVNPAIGLSANQVMQEVEQDTEVGNKFLDSFIDFKENRQGTGQPPSVLEN